MSDWTRDPGPAPPTVDAPIRPGGAWSTQPTSQIPHGPPLQPPHQPPAPPPLPPGAHHQPPGQTPGSKRPLKAIAAVAAVVGLVGGGVVAGVLVSRDGDETASPAPTSEVAESPVVSQPPTTTPPPSSSRPPATVENPPPPTLDEDLEPVAAAAKAASPSVVQLETNVGLGSGFVFTEDGYILTAAHVLGSAQRVTVILGDGSKYDASVVGVNSDTDVGVVKITDPPGDLPVASLALDDPPEVGQTVIAIGSPFGLDQTVTAGIVSTVSRPVPVGNNVVGMIQTDAPINSGNSGGALVDLQGRVIGINDQIRTRTGDNAGIGFAIPIDLAFDVAGRLIAGVPVEWGFLGVASGQDPAFGVAGALITQVVPNSPAEDAGLSAGDVVVAVDGEAIKNYPELVSEIRERQPGDEVELQVRRGEDLITLDVTLGESEGN